MTLRLPALALALAALAAPAAAQESGLFGPSDKPAIAAPAAIKREEGPARARRAQPERRVAAPKAAASKPSQPAAPKAAARAASAAAATEASPAPEPEPELVAAEEAAQPEGAAEPAPPAPSPVADEEPLGDRLPFALDDEDPAEVEAPSATGLLIRTFGALCLIIGLIVAGAWALRRLGGARFGASADAPELSVIANVALGDRRSLSVVRFGERTLLVGSTPQGITLLASEGPEPSAPPIRSVADLLDAGDIDAFPNELGRARLRLTEGDDEEDA
jgi:flagellar biosynthetic protein FliO